jgi:hypothetical protein
MSGVGILSLHSRSAEVILLASLSSAFCSREHREQIYRTKITDKRDQKFTGEIGSRGSQISATLVDLVRIVKLARKVELWIL